MTIPLVLLALGLTVLPGRALASERLSNVVGAPGTSRMHGPGRWLRASGRGRIAPGSGSASVTRLYGLAIRCVARWRRPGVPEDLPMLFDLLASVLASGLPVHRALAAVADALDARNPAVPNTARAVGTGQAVGTTRALSAALSNGPPGLPGSAHLPGRQDLVAALRELSSQISLGAEAHETLATTELLGPLASILARSAHGGGEMCPSLRHAATRLRADADSAALARAERAGVLVAGPLGLCFLPGFICLGIVPVVIGLAAEILPGLAP